MNGKLAGNHREQTIEGSDGVADGPVAAFGSCVGGPLDLQNAAGDLIRQIGLRHSNGGCATHRIACVDQVRAGDGRQVAVDDPIDSPLPIDGRQDSQQQNHVPPQDAVLVPEEAREEIEMRVDQIRCALAQIAQSFGRTELHKRHIGGKCGDESCQ
ncbi:MAG: hypothetical protein ACLQKA_23410 [Bryobacteraceae bacterium]